MNRVAQRLIGTHDFRAFCRRPANVAAGEPLFRRVIEAQWERLDDAWVMSPREVARTAAHHSSPVVLSQHGSLSRLVDGRRRGGNA